MPTGLTLLTELWSPLMFLSKEEFLASMRQECTVVKRKTRVFKWRVIAKLPVTLTLNYALEECCDSDICEPPAGPGHRCERIGDTTEWECTFETIQVRRTEVGGKGLDATYWFAPGVGKVKEHKTGVENEQLVCFTLPTTV